MSNKRILLLIFVAAILQVIPGIKAENNLLAQDREKLLFQEIPIVISASRKEQPITEAATTITVISADDIKYSGATTIPEVLSLVAGVDVMTITARDQQVGVRGFISPANNKLLVLVDGRTMYSDLYGAVFWNLLPIGLEEIQRIEVVKSPASSIYGANAFCGAINIITKTPEQLRGTTFHLTAGEGKTLIGSILHAGEALKNKLQYKISSEWDQTREGQTDTRPTPRTIRANAMFQYSFNDNAQMALSLGRGYSKNGRFLSGGAMGTGLIDFRNDYIQLDFNYRHFKFRTFYRDERPTVNWPLTNDTQIWDIDSLNTEILHNFSIGSHHSVVWGLSYQFNNLEKNDFIEGTQNQHMYALFVEDEIKLSNKWRMTLGARYDDHPLVPGHLSPRASILFTPSPNHLFRFSFTQAFRNPSMEDSYIYIRRESSFSMPPLPVPIRFVFIRKGNPNLEPEGITSYEFGYHANDGHHVTLDANLFYNLYHDFFSLTTSMLYYQANELFPGSPGGVIHKEIVSSIQNKGDAMGIGGEISAAFIFNDHISGTINYSFQKIKDLSDDPATSINEKNRTRTESPKHKINVGLRFILANGFSLNSTAHWVDKTQKWLPNTTGILFASPIADYLLFNTRLGYTFWHNKAEMSISVFNLFNHKHLEYPQNDTAHFPESIAIGRRFTFTLRVKL